MTNSLPHDLFDPQRHHSFPLVSFSVPAHLYLFLYYLFCHSVEEFPGVVTADNYLSLDQMAKNVARMVASAETHLGPVSDWTEDFKRWEPPFCVLLMLLAKPMVVNLQRDLDVRCTGVSYRQRQSNRPLAVPVSSNFRLIEKSRNYEGSAKFVTHFNGRATAAETYKRKLPEGMAVDVSYMEWIKSQPWPPLVSVSTCTYFGPSALYSVGCRFPERSIIDESQCRVDLFVSGW